MLSSWFKIKMWLIFFFFSSHESTWPKIWKKCNFGKPQIVYFFSDSDSIISRIEFKRKKNLAIGFQPTYLNFEILFSHNVCSQISTILVHIVKTFEPWKPFLTFQSICMYACNNEGTTLLKARRIFEEGRPLQSFLAEKRT